MPETIPGARLRQAHAATPECLRNPLLPVSAGQTPGRRRAGRRLPCRLLGSRQRGRSATEARPQVAYHRVSGGSADDWQQSPRHPDETVGFPAGWTEKDGTCSATPKAETKSGAWCAFSCDKADLDFPCSNVYTTVGATGCLGVRYSADIGRSAILFARRSCRRYTDTT